MGFRWMGFSAASFRACWACQVRCLVAGGIGRRRIGATWKVAEGEKVAVGEWRKAARQREGRNGREGEEETARILGSVRSCAVVVVEFGGGGIHNFASCHSVSNRAFSIHSSCTPRGTYERVTRWFARRYGTVEGRARVDSSFSGLLSSGMRHFNPEECTSRRNTDAFLKLAVLSRRVVYIYIYIDADLFSSSLRAFSMIDWQRADKTDRVPIRPDKTTLVLFAAPFLSLSLFYPSLRGPCKRFSRVFVRFFSFFFSLFLFSFFCLFLSPRKKEFLSDA